MSVELIFLGTGTSAGVPMIGCDCPVCQSDDPRDRRSRPSVLVRWADETAQSEDGPVERDWDVVDREGGGHQGPRAPSESEFGFHARFNPAQRGARQVLIDTSPDLREQCLKAKISRLDAVLYTHGHADHIFGLDDLRRFNAVLKRPIELHAEPGVIEQFRRMFPYVFEPHTNVNQSFIPQLIPHPMRVGEAINLHGCAVKPVRLMHGRLPILGLRFDFNGKSIAYCTDCSSIPPQTYPLLRDLDVLVIDALRYRHHPTHLTIDQALSIIDELQPRKAFLTHIAHDVQHADLCERLPAGVELPYDGLAVKLG
jgi:phosphoribosyl 1,2-cyclic phosphate phosphodiesterase